MDPLLLVVDDEPPIREYLTRCGNGSGFRVITCQDGREALDFLDTQSADMAIVDLCMPNVDGLEVIRAIRRKDPHCQVVLMSGASGRITDAVEAIKLGARDYLQKPFKLESLQTLLTDVRQGIDKRKSALLLESQIASESELCGMVGRSPVMQELFAMIRRLGPHVKTALVTGESGTGKDMVAAALHQTGRRAGKELLAFSCSGVTEMMAESDLFGHVHGAFQGATEDRPGAFEKADEGVVFFDEIAELPLAVQGRLLRFLEKGQVQRLGSLESRHVDVAVVAATRRDLRTEMMAGRFRRELYYRLSTVELQVPPLRDRKEDIPYLAHAFSRDSAARLGKSIAGLTVTAEALLRRRDWPGNVRELRNVIEHACLMCDGELITERDVMHALGKISS
jgi:DNA-binding NtrC family response regulator